MPTSAPPLPFTELKIVLGPIIFSSNNWHWNVRTPNCFNLWIALEGQAELETLEKSYSVQPGTAFVFPPHQKVAAKSVAHQPFRNFACRFTPPKGSEAKLLEQTNQLMGIQSSDLAQTRELCRAAIKSSHYSDALGTQQSTGLCLQILAQAWRDAHTTFRYDPDEALLRLMDRIREQPSLRLSLEEMANETHLSVAQLNRRFLAISAESPINFAIRHRIQHAKHSLHGSSLQISDIAHALGYNDIYFFSRQFKQITGMSPSEYRRSLAAEAEDNT